MKDSIVLAVSLEGLAAELWFSLRANGLGEAKVLESLLDSSGDREGGGGGQTMHPWVTGMAIHHHQVVVAACHEQIHAHRLHGLRCGGGWIERGGRCLAGECLGANLKACDSVVDGSIRPRPVI